MMNVWDDNNQVDVIFSDPEKGRKKVKWHRWLYAASWAVLIYLLFFYDAIGHSFYHAICCDDRDCKPIPSTSVKITPEGYLWDGYLFPFDDSRIYPAPDGNYHGCENPQSKQKLCLYVPAFGS